MSTVSKSDAECIENSYEDQLNALFKQFFLALSGETNSSNDQNHLKMFENGLSILKRAKALALGAVVSSSAMTAEMKPNKRRKQK